VELINQTIIDSFDKYAIKIRLKKQIRETKLIKNCYSGRFRFADFQVEQLQCVFFCFAKMVLV